jgi:hypothetical protein
MKPQTHNNPREEQARHHHQQQQHRSVSTSEEEEEEETQTQNINNEWQVIRNSTKKKELNKYKTTLPRTQ